MKKARQLLANTSKSTGLIISKHEGTSKSKISKSGTLGRGEKYMCCVSLWKELHPNMSMCAKPDCPQSDSSRIWPFLSEPLKPPGRQVALFDRVQNPLLNMDTFYTSLLYSSFSPLIPRVWILPACFPLALHPISVFPRKQSTKQTQDSNLLAQLSSSQSSTCLWAPYLHDEVHLLPPCAF